MSPFLRIWIFLLLSKVIFGLFIPLSSDESYYWVWSKNLQLSYFDHPGMVAWWFKLGEVFEPFYHAVRLPSVILAHFTLLVWREILKNKLTENELVVWLIICGANPLVFLSGVIVTPDTPLLLFWSLGVLFFQRALKTRALFDYTALGAVLGLGFCSKYNIVIFIFAVAALLLFAWKKLDIKFKYIPATIAVGLIFSMPVLYWNYTNEFVSFRFQMNHGLGSESWKPYWTTSYLFGQFLLIFPLVFMKGISFSNFKKDALLYVFGWVPIGFFLLTSFKGLVEANWPLVGYPAIIALATPHLSRAWKKATYLGLTSIYLIALSLIVYPWIHVGPLEEKVSEITGPHEVYPYLKKDVPLFAPTYQMASKITYDTGIRTYKVKGISRVDFYDFQEESIPKSEFLLVTKKTVTLKKAKKIFNLTGTAEISDRYTIYRMEPKKTKERDESQKVIDNETPQ